MNTLLSRLVALVLLSLPSAAWSNPCPLDGELVRRIVACRSTVTTAQCRRVAEAIGCSVVHELPLINAIVITVPERGADGHEAKLKGQVEVESVEADRKVRWLNAAMPSPRSVLESARLADVPAAPGKPLASPSLEISRSWGVDRVKAPALWPVTEGAGVKVAVIDTGIDATHADLGASVAGGWNAVNPEKPADWKDGQGHGTHVAGTIAGRRDGLGVVGVAPGAKLYAVKVLDEDGNGSYADVIAGLDWAVRNRMQVANMSLGADEGSPALRAAVRNAAKLGLVIVAAAGNSEGGPVSFPGVYPETIAVSASDRDDRFASFSSVGPEVDLIAPGAEILSTMPGGAYESLSGTSMAAPHVAGLAALAIARGARGVNAVLGVLSRAAKPLPGLPREKQGAGLVDAGKL